MSPYLFRYVVFITITALLGACGGGGGGGGGSSSSDPTISTTDLSGLSSVTITPASGIVVVGKTLQLRALGTFSDGDIKDVTAAVDWMSVGDASVNSTGVVTGLEPGGAAISTFSSQDSNAAAGVVIDVAKYDVEGSENDPVVIAADSTHQGSVHKGGDNAAPYSYYSLPTTPGETYYFRLENMTDEVELEVFDDAAFSNQLCITSYDFTPDDQCVVNAPEGGGNLYVRVDGSDTLFSPDNSAAYDLTVLRGYRTEGPVDIPLNTPTEGQVGVVGESTYRFPTVYGGKYTVEITGLSESVRLLVTNGADTECFTWTPSLADQTCAFQAVEAEATARVVSDYATADLGTPFTITVTEDHGAYSDEGTIAAPVTLAEGEVHVGQVGTEGSYYSIPTTPGMSYVVTLEAVDSWSKMEVYDGDSSYTLYGEDCEGRTSPDEAPATCRMEPVETSNLYIKVSGNEFGADYRLTVAEINYLPEGTPVAPMYLDPVPSVYTEPYAGQVDNTISYYRIDAVAGADYNVTLTNVSGNVAAALYDDAALSTLLCSSDNVGLADESCSTTTPVSGTSLYVAVTGDTYGARFDMTLDRVYNPEGTTTVPLDKTSELPTISGETGTGTELIDQSYYTVTLTAGKSYRFTVSDYTHDSVGVMVFDSTPDVFYSGYDCQASKNIYMDVPYTCTVGPLLTDEVTLRVRATSSVFGAAFSINIDEITYEQEGSVATPLDIGSYPEEVYSIDSVSARHYLAYYGQSGNGSSYYVADISGGHDYVGFKAGLINQGTDANIYVYDDPGYTNLLCSSVNGSMADEYCNFNTAGDQLYIRVDGSPSGFGALYTVVVDGDFGSDGAPLEGNGGNLTGGAVELMLGMPHQGQASQSASSYYMVPATAGVPYTISVSDLFNPVCVYAYTADDGYFTTSYGLNYDSNKGLSDKTLVVTPEVNALYFKLVSCPTTTTEITGTAYTVNITAN